MFEGWAAVAVGAAASVVGGAMQGRGASKAADKQTAADKEIARIQGVEERKTGAYQLELADYYKQLDRQRNRDSRAGMYDKYSLVQKPADYVRANLAGPKPPNPDATTSARNTPAVNPSTGEPIQSPAIPLPRQRQP